MTAMAMALSLLGRGLHNASSPFSLRTDKVGPIVLACVGKIDHNEAIVLPLDAAADPATWLVPVPGAPLQYTAKGVADALFVPPWMIGNRSYTMYPVFAK